MTLSLSPLVAVGDIGIEHFIAPGSDGSERWSGARPDGLAPRVAARLAHVRDCSLIGAAADDEDGVTLTSELRARGVQLALWAHEETTRQGFVLRGRPATPLFPPSPRRVTRRCLVCGQRQPQTRSSRLEAESWLQQRQPGEPAVLMFDRLGEFRRRLAVGALQRGGSSIVVLDDPGPLRFLPALDLLATINEFELVILGWRVARTLGRRLGLGLASSGELARLGGFRNLVTLEASGALSIQVGDQEPIEFPPAPIELAPDDLIESFVTFAAASWSPHLGQGQRAELLLGAARLAQQDRVEDLLIGLPRLALGASLEELSVDYETLAADLCPLCRLPREQARIATASPTRRRTGARTNVGWLTRRAFAATERTTALDGLRVLLGTPGTAYCVGSGGSYPVASFAAQILMSHGRLFAQPARPMDYVRTARGTDALVVVSYSGSNADTAAVLTHARELDVGRIALICASANPPLASLLRPTDLLLSHGNPRREGSPERGFVSIAATVAPCALLAAAVVRPDDLADLRMRLPELIDGDAMIAERLAAAMRDEASLAVLGGGWAWPTMLDLESKWMESDLGNISIHEAKDFSHGRFLSVLGTQAGQLPIVLGVGRPSEYEQSLLVALQELSPVALWAHREGAAGAFELLLRAQFVTERVASELGRDISRPESIPKEGLRLYRWSDSRAAMRGTGPA